MFSRFAGRLVTGPLAFLVAGVLDVMLFVTASLWFRAARRVRNWRASAG